MNNNARPLVAIGIPTYNRADNYLKQTLKSALNQTYQNLEIIVADNCSTDNTEDFVNRNSDPRIRYFRHNKNIYANDNFNFCLKQAKGDYFLLLHDDDLIDQDFVEVCMAKATFNPDCAIIRTGTRVIDSQGVLIHESLNRVGGLSFEEFILGWFKYKTSFYFCSTLFNTTKLKAIGGFQSKRNLLQDGVAIARLNAKHDRLDIHEIKASFRKHGDEMTFAVKVKDWSEDFLFLLDLICELASENRAVLRDEGHRFFASLSYNRVSAIQSKFKRFITYVTVFRTFGYKHLPPPVRRVKRIINNFLRN